MNEFAEALRRMLRENMNDYTDDMAKGQCRSYDEYQKLCGVIQGLAIAERHLLDLLQKVEERDDE